MKHTSNSKKVLLIGGNYYPEPTGIGKYNGEMVDMLAKKGYQCTVITSFPYYPYWKIQEPYTKRGYWYKKEIMHSPGSYAQPVEVYRCPQYVPKKPSGFKRMLLDFSFCFFAFLKLVQLLFKNRYELVITVVPCFQLGLLGLFYKKIRGAKFLYHIQDLQIDAARDLKMIKSPTVIKLLLHIEKFILKNADIVSTISVGMVKKIKAKQEREVVLFPNWVDTKSFYPLYEKKELKEEFNLKPNDRVVLYSGAIGEKQGLENILYAAKAFQNTPDLIFVICGSGPYKEKLQKMKDELQLENIIFLPLQPAENLNRFLNMPDVHLVLQKGNAGDLVMPSKLTTLLAVGGLTIVSASPDSNLYDLISLNEIGFVIEPDNQQSLTMAIGETLKVRTDNIKKNARRYAEEFLSIDHIFSGYLKYL
jgi:colanic acid biosynthesis glycosyl transferase WcaI